MHTEQTIESRWDWSLQGRRRNVGSETAEIHPGNDGRAGDCVHFTIFYTHSDRMHSLIHGEKRRGKKWVLDIIIGFRVLGEVAESKKGENGEDVFKNGGLSV